MVDQTFASPGFGFSGRAKGALAGGLDWQIQCRKFAEPNVILAEPRNNV